MKLVVILLIAQAVLLGCAKVEVHPASWETTEKEGIPFYLQRPYVVVQKSFPIEGEEGYLFGTIDRSTGTVHFQDMSDKLSKRIGVGKEIPISTIRKEERELGRTHSAEDVVRDHEPPSEEAERERSTEEEVVTDASGIAKWDASVPDTVEINEFFKIVYLPDLDEKYVISPSAGIGSARLSVAMGPGGVINQFQVNLDNSEIGKFVMNSAKTVVSLAEKAADLSIGKLFSAVDIVEARAIVVKYIYIGYATPGIYPILKNSEYAKSHGRAVQDPYLIPAEWPYTRFSVKVKKQVLLVADPLLDTVSGPGTRDADGEAKPEPESKAPPGIAKIEQMLRDANDINVEELTVAAKFSSIIEDRERRQIVFTIPLTNHTGLPKDKIEAIKKAIWDKVTELVGDERAKVLTDNNYVIVLMPERE